MRLLAISDLHVGTSVNREALTRLGDYPEDWLIVGGDLVEGLADARWALGELTRRFAKVIWAPGNHDLWTTDGLRGEAKYRALLELCGELGVLTPEDPWPTVPGTSYVVASSFVLYDYSFRPPEVSLAQAVAWAAETHVTSADELFLRPDPFATRQDWCAARCEHTEARLAAVPHGQRVILVNHFPLLEELVRLRRIERFRLWCGTQRTRGWLTRYPVAAVVYGHLHMRSSEWRDGVRFEEVSLGMPKHWDNARGMDAYLREIWPGGMQAPPGGNLAPVWRW